MAQKGDFAVAWSFAIASLHLFYIFGAFFNMIPFTHCNEWK